MNVLISSSILVAFICLIKVEMYDSYRTIKDGAAGLAMEGTNQLGTETGRFEEYDFENFFRGDILDRYGTVAHARFEEARKALRWPDGTVPYILDETYSESEKDLIRSAMAEFRKETCIKWIERTDEDNYVEIYKESGCWSELGRVGGVQSLSLQSPFCMKKGVIMHNMMHTLGFVHEQSRYDRDDYVHVAWDNIINGMQSNFVKLSPVELNTLGLDYDYSSIMHYRAHQYAKDRSKPTLKSKNPQVSPGELGSAVRKGAFTDLDVLRINGFYECPGSSTHIYRRL